MAGGGSVSFAQKIAARNVLQRAAGNFYSLSNFHFHLTREVESVVDLLSEYFKISICTSISVQYVCSFATSAHVQFGFLISSVLVY